MKARIGVVSESRNRFLACSALLIVLIMFANSLFFVLLYECGYPQGTFLPGPRDRFADLIKVSLSFKKITAGIGATPEFQSWSPLFRNYYSNSIYGGIENLDSGGLTHFHHPPLSQLLFTICAYVLTATVSPGWVLGIWFGLYCMAGWMVFNSVESRLRTHLFMGFVLFACLFSYPALFLMSRANYNAGFVALLISCFLLRACRNEKPDWICLLSLAFAINIRPNALFFLAALPLIFGTKRSVKPLLSVLAMSLAIFIACLSIEHHLDSDYSLSTFLRALHTYDRLYLLGGWGDAANSSLYALLKTSTIISGSRPVFSTLFTSFGLVAGLLLLALPIVWRAGNRVLSSFVLVSLYALLTPIFADYHLLVFLAPLCLIYVDWENWETNRRTYSLILLSSVLMLAPKNYIYFDGLSCQTILNPLILLVSLVLLCYYMSRQQHRPAGGREASVPEAATASAR